MKPCYVFLQMGLCSCNLRLALRYGVELKKFHVHGDWTVEIPDLARTVKGCLQCGQDVLIRDENGKNWGAIVCAALVCELCGTLWLDAAALVVQKANFTKIDTVHFCNKAQSNVPERNWRCIGVVMVLQVFWGVVALVLLASAMCVFLDFSSSRP